MARYDHKKIERKWQKEWAKKKIYLTKDALPSDSKVALSVPDKSTKEKCYVLDMFPYPSGEGLHVGHPKGYIATDIYSRFKRMNGFNVLHPMGWDAFGLPAENFAIKNKTHPRKSVEANIKRYKEQLSIIGFDHDWSREINTTDPEYYKWTQWIFLQMYKKGLAYQSFEPINWCPSCQTGLANEDLEDGRCERCGSVVEKRPMRQWVLKITDYAERLLSDITNLNWPEYIKESQRNWIGKSKGAEINFTVEFEHGQKSGTIPVFTTRADTIYGVTAIVFSPEHLWVRLVLDENHKGVVNNADEVRAYVNNAAKKNEIERTDAKKEKTGIKLSGVWAINPATKEKIPVFVADYVLSTYGTGAVMVVPAHDERDFAFAKKYNIPIKEVVIPRVVDTHDPPRADKKTVERKAIQVILIDPKTGKVLVLKWKKFPWTTFITGGVEKGEDLIEAAKREIIEETGYKNVSYKKTLGGQVESHFFANHKDENRKAYFSAMLFELMNDERDEISEDEKAIHETHWLTWKEIEADKNTKCSEYDIWIDRMFNPPHAFIDEGVLIESGEFSLRRSEEVREEISKKFGKIVTTYRLRDWVFSRQRYWGEPIPLIHCEKCGIVPVPEKDLPVKLPEVKHYEPTGSGESPLAVIDKWVNVKCPSCGGKGERETNTMPQWAGSSWYYLRYMDPKNKKAPVDSAKEKYWAPVDVYVGGAEHATRHLIYARFWHKFLYDIGVVSTLEPFTRLYNVGLILGEDGKKMSKRFGNVINPDDVVGTYGADTFRVYEMFMGPFSQSSAWDTKSIMGSRRFVERVVRIGERVIAENSKNAKTKKTISAERDISRIKNPALTTALHRTIKKVTEDILQFNFNTAISSLMVFSHDLELAETISKETFGTFLKLCSPFIPHITEELWSELKMKGSVHISGWPAFDPSLIRPSEYVVAVQVNGRVRGEVKVTPDMTEEDIVKLANDEPVIKKWLNNKPVRKHVYIKNKILSLVV